MPSLYWRSSKALFASYQRMLDVYVEPFRPLGRGVAIFYPGQILAASDYLAELEAEFSRVREKRALIFWGMKDPGFPQSDLRHMEKICPNLKTIELLDANHFFFEDAAPRMIEEIALFASSKSKQIAASKWEVRE